MVANSLAKERSEGRGKRRDREKERGEGRVDGGDATALGARSNSSRPARPPDLVPCSFSLPLPLSLPQPPLCIPSGQPRPPGRPQQEPKLFCNHDEKVVLIKSDVARRPPPTNRKRHALSQLQSNRNTSGDYYSLCHRPREKMRFPGSLLRPTLRRVVSLDFVLIVSVRRGIAMAFNLSGSWSLRQWPFRPPSVCHLQGPRPPSSRLPTPIWGNT